MPLLLLALIVVPLVELYVIIQVGQAIGVLWTIALLLADSILGGMLMRSQGRRAWRRFTGAMAEGRMPAGEVLDGVLVIFGGAFLLTPGFVTDLFGIALLAPPTRALIRKLVLRRFTVRLTDSVRAQQFARSRYAPDAAGHHRDFDVEGTAHDAEPPALGHDAP
ncbi:MAG: FxsA family protein [Solirubrobacterales bacterium]|nr:FxsA family protein [Solirubrobacterales bacterium]